jgi:hypothetical protein
MRKADVVAVRPAIFSIDLPSEWEYEGALTGGITPSRRMFFLPDNFFLHSLTMDERPD